MAASISYGATDSIVSTTTTFNHNDVGLVSGDYLGLAFQGTQQGATSQSISSVSINGSGATLIWSQVQPGGTDVNGNRAMTAMALVAHPGGSTADISITWGATMFDDVVSTFGLTDIETTPFVTPVVVALTTNQTTANLSMNFPAGGVGFASCCAYVIDNNPGMTWTGYTEAGEQTNFGSNTYGTATYAAVADQTPLTGSCNFADGTGAGFASVAGLAVSFAEAAGGLSIPVAHHHYSMMRRR